MADIDQAATLDLAGSRGRGPLLKWAIIGVAVLLLLGAGAAVWYFFLGGRAHFAPKEAKEIEAPLPFFLELKTFVVSMPSSTGASHFVQLGVSLQLPRAAASEMVNALLPELQDAMRQMLLGFKSEDLQNPDGVNKVRGVMIERLNKLMAVVLGPDRIAKLTEGSPDGAFVQNVLFTTLIVE
ncbi:MAG TPA: flagellar basal body-associated FliL family protein [Stellaceae bacterium]|nr:flagellar basal body-associated FliL family protein [Stellaceae bacterium]